MIKGSHHTKQSKEHLRKINLGKRHSDKTKRKISSLMRGRKITWKDKISESLKGHGVSEEVRKKIGERYKGKKLSEIHRRKMSDVRIGKYPKSYYHRLGTLSTVKQNKNKEPTSIEKKVYEELKAKGFLFETQKLINDRFLVDAYVPSLNLVIEADGNYWHSLLKAIGRDKSRNAYLKKCGFDLLRLTETEINNGSFKGRLEKVIKIIKSKSGTVV